MLYTSNGTNKLLEIIVRYIRYNAGLQEIFNEYKKVKSDFNRFAESFNSQYEILEHSILPDDIDEVTFEVIKSDTKNQLSKIKSDIQDIEHKFHLIDIILKTADLPKLRNAINKEVRKHEELLNQVNEIKQHLPIVQTIRLYLHVAIDKLKRLCALVKEFFKKTLPNEAKKAGKNLTESFNSLKKAEQDSNNPSDKGGTSPSPSQ